MSALYPLALLAVWAPLPAEFSGKWRVVVQDAQHIRPLALSADADLAVCAGGGRRGHILLVIDRKAPRIVLERHFIGAVQFAAFSPDDRRLAVSTGSGVHLVNLADGKTEEVLPGTIGAVTFHRDGNRLGVLGMIPALAAKDRQLSLRDPATLAAYDLKARRWVAHTRTPILIDHQVVFAGDKLIGYGQGGRVFSRISGLGYPCDVTLDLKTKRSVLRRGVEPKRSVRRRGVRKRAIDPLPEGADPDYKPPEAIRAFQKRQETVAIRAFQKRQERVPRKDPFWTRFQTFPRFGLREFDFAALALKDRALVSLRRVVGQAVLTIREDGSFTVGEPRVTREPAWPGEDTLLARGEPERNQASFLDLLTGEKFLVPYDRKGQLLWHRAREGVLKQEEKRLAFYPRGAEKPAWVHESADLKNAFPRPSEDGRKLVVYLSGQKALVRILRARDGKVLGEVPRPEGLRDNYVRAACIHPDKPLAGAVVGTEFQVYDLEKKKVVARQALDEEEHTRFVAGVRDGWILSGKTTTRLWDARRGWGTKIAEPNVNLARDVDTAQGRRLLLETSNGVGLLADPASGEVLARWAARRIGSGWRDRPPQAEVAFGGKLLIRANGWLGEVELVRLRDLRTLLTVHPVPVGKSGLGWVAYTPDGLWDASRDAERLVQVFRAGKVVDAETRADRRKPGAIRERLKAALD